MAKIFKRTKNDSVMCTKHKTPYNKVYIYIQYCNLSTVSMLKLQNL